MPTEGLGPPPARAVKSLLFIGPLPEPLTGQSLACRLLLDELTKHYRVDVINLSKRNPTQPRTSLTRIVEIFQILVAVRRRQRAADAIYLTVSESYLGNIKDLLIYFTCFRSLRRMVIHLYGGAGLRRIMLTRGHPLRRSNEFFMRRLGGAIVEGSRQRPTFANTILPERIHLVPNFAEDYLFCDAEAIDRKFRTAEPLRVLFLSNLLPGKGHKELIDAFRSLVNNGRVELDIAGAFDSEDAEREFHRQIAGTSQIRYHGPVRGVQKRDLFQGAHVFCLPTYYAYEGQPLSILEAYAAGCAVITTDHSGIRDVFTAGRNGYEVIPRSVTSLRTALEEAVADPQRLRTMALANLTAARTNYRAAQYRDRMILIIESIAARTDLEGGIEGDA